MIKTLYFTRKMGKILNVHSCCISSCCTMLIQNLRLPSSNRNLFTIIILNTLPGQGKIVPEGVWVQGGVKGDPLFLWKHPEENKWYITVACEAGVFYSANDMVLIFFFGRVKKGFQGRGWWLKIKEGEGGGEEKIFLFSPSPASFATAFKMAAAINVPLSFN